MCKKVCICVLTVLFCTGMTLFAQNTPATLPVHQRTAQRYADLAIQSYLVDAVDTAVNYAEMALAYDASNADALYVRGLCSRQSGDHRAEYLKYFEDALASGAFYNYSKDTVRIALAQEYLLQRRFTDVLAMIDAEPKLLTAESQYLRGTSLYATGKLKEARTLIATAWRLYPRDIRFPKLFFTSEKPEVTEGIPSFAAGAKELGLLLLKNLPSWTDTCPELNLYAAAFVPASEGRRLLKQYTGAVYMKDRIPYYATVGLSSAYLTADEAVERFEKLCNGTVVFADLQEFTQVLAQIPAEDSHDALIQFREWLADFSGIILIDTDDNGFVSVQYRNGRPLLATCDIQLDQVSDWQCAFDYGMPRQFVDLNADTTVTYARYPWVTSVHTAKQSWELLPDSVSWPSIAVEPCAFLPEVPHTRDFYIPIVEYHGILPDEQLLRPYAWKLSYAYDITLMHRFEYQLQDGKIISCLIETPEQDLAVTTFVDSIPSYRVTDLNSDGFTDVVEYYEVVENEPSEEERELTRRLYGPFTPDAFVRLSRMEIESEALDLQGFVYDIDRNGLETLFWDMKSDGSFSQKVTKEADRSSLSFTLIDPLQDETIVITTFADGTVSVNYNGIDLPVAYDRENDFYWINETDDAIDELKDTAMLLRQAVIAETGEKPAGSISVTIDEVMYRVSKNADQIFGTRRLDEDLR